MGAESLLLMSVCLDKQPKRSIGPEKTKSRESSPRTTCPAMDVSELFVDALARLTGIGKARVEWSSGNHRSLSLIAPSETIKATISRVCRVRAAPTVACLLNGGTVFVTQALASLRHIADTMSRLSVLLVTVHPRLAPLPTTQSPLNDHGVSRGVSAQQRGSRGCGGQ